jgi:hypothetical protein
MGAGGRGARDNSQDVLRGSKMSLLDTILATARDQFPAIAGSTFFAVLSKPEKKWHRVFIFAGGLVISQIFTEPTTGHLHLEPWAGAIGFIYGLLGITIAMFSLSMIEAAKEYAPDVIKGWLNRILGGTNNGPD